MEATVWSCSVIVLMRGMAGTGRGKEGSGQNAKCYGVGGCVCVCVCCWRGSFLAGNELLRKAEQRERYDDVLLVTRVAANGRNPRAHTARTFAYTALAYRTPRAAMSVDARTTHMRHTHAIPPSPPSLSSFLVTPPSNLLVHLFPASFTPFPFPRPCLAVAHFNISLFPVCIRALLFPNQLPLFLLRLRIHQSL